MEKIYYLDLPTLLGYIRGKSAVLRTTIALARNQPASQGIIFLLPGNVMHCYILNQDGALVFKDDDAHKRLKQSAEWQVRIDAEQVIGQEWLTWLQQHNLAQRPPALPASTGILRPKKALDALTLSQFSHQQALFLRTIFSLVNGQRTVEQIKARLPQTAPQAIDDALNVLRTLGVIE